MTLEITLQEDCETPHNPPLDLLQLWIGTTLTHVKDPPQEGEITVKFINEEESAVLNQTFRNKPGPTNLLSFPYDNLDGSFTGDLAICAPLVKQQAHDQGKLVIAHWAHLVIHGTLHLLGYDHIEESDALVMESIESTIMHQLNFEDPYGEQN